MFNNNYPQHTCPNSMNGLGEMDDAQVEAIIADYYKGVPKTDGAIMALELAQGDYTTLRKHVKALMTKMCKEGILDKAKENWPIIAGVVVGGALLYKVFGK